MKITKEVKNMTEVKNFVVEQIKYLENPKLLIRRFVHTDGDLECLDIDVEIYDDGTYLECLNIYSTDYQEHDFSLDEKFALKELKQVFKYVRERFENRCEVVMGTDIDYA